MTVISATTLRFLRIATRSEQPVVQQTARCASLNAHRAHAPRSLQTYPRTCSRRRAYSSTPSRPSQAASAATPDSSSTPIPAPRPTYYELFPKTLPRGPPPSGSFAVDVRALRNEFLQLQAKAHPDLHSGENKKRAEATSALINEAYKTVQDPLRRAQYLLGLQGIETDKDEAAKLDGEDGGDGELLMKVMEVNELVEEAEVQEDVDALKGPNSEKIRDSVGKLEKLFAAGELEDARKEAIRLRYWTNIKQSLDEWEPGKPTVLVH